jgi:hypothetical protein
LFSEVANSELASVQEQLRVLRAAPEEALGMLRGRAAVLARHQQALPCRTLRAALQAPEAGRVLLGQNPALTPGQAPVEVQPGADWVLLSAFAEVAGIGTLAKPGKPAPSADAQAKRVNRWAAEAAGSLEGARKVANHAKDRKGAWVAPLDEVLFAFGLP